MFRTHFEATRNIISEMDKFGLVSDPTFAIFLQFYLMDDRVVMKLKSLHFIDYISLTHPKYKT